MQMMNLPDSASVVDTLTNVCREATSTPHVKVAIFTLRFTVQISEIHGNTSQ